MLSVKTGHCVMISFRQVAYQGKTRNLPWKQSSVGKLFLSICQWRLCSST